METIPEMGAPSNMSASHPSPVPTLLDTPVPLLGLPTMVTSSDAPEDASDATTAFFDAFPPPSTSEDSSTQTDLSTETELQRALLVVENADFKTASALQKACTARMEKIHEEFDPHFNPQVHEPQKKHYEQAKSSGTDSLPKVATEDEPELTRTLSTITIVPAKKRRSTSISFHASNPFHMPQKAFSLLGIEASRPIANTIPVSNDINSSKSIHAPRKLHRSNPWNLEFHTSDPSNQSRDESVGHVRTDSQSSDKGMKSSGSMKRSGSIVLHTGDRLRESFVTMKDMVKETAAIIPVFSSPKKNKTLPSLDSEEEMMLFDSPRSPKKLKLVREESPLGTKIWAVRGKKDQSNSDGKESPPPLILGPFRSDEDSFLGGEFIRQYTTLASETSPTRQSRSKTLLSAPLSSEASQNSSQNSFLGTGPCTPLPRLGALPRSKYPPRVSSLKSPVSTISKTDSNYIDDSSDTIALEGSNASNIGGEEGSMVQQDFQPIRNSRMMQGFQRIASDDHISRSASVVSLDSPKKAGPRVPAKDEALARPISRARSERKSTFRARAFSSLRKATGSIKRTKRNAMGDLMSRDKSMDR